MRRRVGRRQFGRLLLWPLLAVAVVACCPAEWEPYKLAPPSPSREWSPPPEPVKVDARCYTTDFFKQACELLTPGEPLSVVKLVDIALQASPETRMTWAAARAAAADYGLSRGEVYPEIWGQVDWLRHRQATFFGGSTLQVDAFTLYQPFLEISWVLFNFGATQATIEQARQTLLAANWTHNRAVQTLIQTVLVDYYTYIAAQQQYEAGLADLADAEINLDQTELRHKFGIADLTDEAMALAQVAQTRLFLLDYEQAMVDTLARLQADAGLPANISIDIEGITSEIPMRDIQDTVDEAVCQAYRARPDLRAAYATVEAKRSAVYAAWREALPSLAFNGDFGKRYYNGGISDKYDFDFGLTLYIPLFQGFQTFNQWRRARAELQKAQSQLRAMEIAMIQDVVAFYRDFQIAADKVYAGEAYVMSAEESYKAALAQYGVGTVDFTTVAAAFKLLADARAALVDARRDWYVSLTDLAYAIGILSEPESCTWKCHEDYNVFE